MSACPLCRQRKAKRACPALGEAICSHCCGTKRLVEIDCPDDCVYLGEHAHGWAGRETEKRRDARRLAPYLEELTERQIQLVFVLLVGVAGLRRERRETTDALLREALETLRKTAESRSNGILYDHQADDLRAHALVLELRRFLLSHVKEDPERALDDRDLLPALGALVGAVDATGREGAGASAFLEMAGRVAGHLAAPRSEPPSTPRIIV